VPDLVQPISPAPAGRGQGLLQRAFDVAAGQLGADEMKGLWVRAHGGEKKAGRDGAPGGGVAPMLPVSQGRRSSGRGCRKCRVRVGAGGFRSAPATQSSRLTRDWRRNSRNRHSRGRSAAAPC
jgi:hypothetical protein